MQVYFNLHKKTWSIRDPKTGRVQNRNKRTMFVVLTGVTFKVNEKARQRVIAEKRKNVHAFAVGTVQDTATMVGRFAEATVPVSYNPYKAGHFVRTDTGEPVHEAKLLLMSTRLVEKEGGRLVRVAQVKAAL